MLALTALLLTLALLLLLATGWTLSRTNRLRFLEMMDLWGQHIMAGLLLLALPVLLLVSPRLWATPDPQAQLTPSLGVRSAELVTGQAPAAGPGISLTPVNVSSAVSNATLTLTIPAVANRTNFCTGFEITAGGATAATSVNVSLAGVIGGTQNYILAIPTPAASAVNNLIIEFTYPLQASTTNTAIVLTVGAGGAGNTNVSGCIHGYLQ